MGEPLRFQDARKIVFLLPQQKFAALIFAAMSGLVLVRSDVVRVF